jgi:arabinogalactan oligomer/maltooligosaccharide transport system substrate-binding protein
MSGQRILEATLLLLAVALSASAETTTFRLWHSFRGDEEKGLRIVVEAFNLQHDDRIELIARQGDTLIEEIERAMPTGRGPDLFIWAHDKIGPWAERGLIAPIDGLLDEAGRAEYLGNCLEAMRLRGKTWGLPFAFETLIVYYNKALVAEPPRTTTAMIEAGRKISNRAEDRWGLVYERGNLYYHAMWLHGFGGRVFDADGRITLFAPELARSLEFARDLATIHGIVPDTVDWNRQMTLFNEGRAGILISGPWAFGSIDRRRVDLGIAPLPVIEATGEPAMPFLGVKGVFISARTRNRAAAFRAARFLASGYAGQVMNLMAGYLPANKAAYNYPAVASDPVTARFKEQALFAVPMPAIPAMARVWKTMNRDDAIRYPGCVESVLTQGVPAEKAVAEAATYFGRLR